jgi:cobalt-zinc-cadmium efflux system membrane fusion protein
MTKRTSILLLQALLFAAGCHKQPEEKASAEPSVQGDVITLADPKEFASSVTVETASKAPEQGQQFNGRLLWDDNATVRIFSPFAGRVEKLMAEVGQQLPQNAPLALIASPDFGQAETDARRAEIDWEHAQRIAERYHDLFEHGAAARKDLDAAEADLARAEAEKTRALARMKFYTGSSNCFAPFFPLSSPIGGVVVEKNINPGQEVRPDQMLANAPQFVLPLFVVTDPNRLWVQVDVGEAQAGQVKAGSPLVIRSQAFPNQTFNGKVDVVAEGLDPTTHTLRLRGSLENPNRALKAYMFVTVELPQAESAEVRVPVKAVFLKKDQHFVFVEVQPGKYQRKPVKISGEYGNSIGVAEGLAPGDRVVCEGSLLLEQVYHSATVGT